MSIQNNCAPEWLDFVVVPLLPTVHTLASYVESLLLKQNSTAQLCFLLVQMWSAQQVGGGGLWQRSGP